MSENRRVGGGGGKVQNQIIFVMSYLNHDYSLSYSIQQPADSSESEADFLKGKLIETHSKLIQQLQYSKKLQEQLFSIKCKLDSATRSNDDLSRKLHSLGSKHDRAQQDRLKQLELNLVECEKKNDLLRGDLESMRNKTLELVGANQKLQDQCNQYERSNSKLSDKISVMGKQAKLREAGQEQAKQQAERYRLKYDKQVSNNQEIEADLREARRQREDLLKRNEELEVSLRLEKDKQAKQFNQILMLQKEGKDWRIRAEEAFEEIAKIRDEAYQLRARTKGEDRNLALELQKLTQEYNNLQLMLRQKDTELESARLKTAESYSRKKHTYQHTKQLVVKMERKQNKLINQRSSPSRPQKQSPLGSKGLKSYKEQKQDYLSMIESVGTMQSQMLGCNLEKKKLLAEIDKIDQTRIKTKDMISKRRRLEVQLQNQDRKLEHVRAELKKMKVM